MSYNGSGLFQINTSGQPVVAGTVITASAFNALTADLATGLTTAITKDGQTATTAQIPFAQGLRSTLVTDSTTSTSGSIITDGGLGVAKAVNIGTTLGVTGAVTGSSTITGTKLIPTGTSATGNGMYLPATNTLGFSTNGTLAAVIDGSQNVGVGVTPSAWSLGKNIEIGSIGNSLMGRGANDVALGANVYYNAGFKYAATGLASLYETSAGVHYWYNAPSGTAGNAITFTQAMTLDASGNFLLGVTTAGSSGLSGFSFNSPTGPSNVWIGHTTGTASGTAYVGFNYNGSGIGSITQNGTTGVLYNLMSDYRLKNNQEDLTGAKDFIMALKPKKWQWWDGSGEGVGFIAHEFMEVAKYSGHGEKDAVDEEGNPVYQSIQPSSTEVMANLVSLIQEQQALITQLQADVAALKG
jgi:hypothetical protein